LGCGVFLVVGFAKEVQCVLTDCRFIHNLLYYKG
jgi:hypothetical protein